ncbi:MAG TPA: TetR/AcrR family transcriptional regulator [Sphingopyxis sp.]|nr:TetR/AcrR family transcriptional regulator [Sphingopyxis sp.]
MAVSLSSEQVDEVRDRIRQIAERQMADRGVAQVSLRSVAAEMGWTAASLYRYFRNKAELIVATRAAAYERFSDGMEAAYHSTDDLWDRSRAIGEAYVNFAFREPAAYKLIFAYEQETEATKTEALRQAELRSQLMLTNYVADMVDGGLLEGDAEQIAHVYWAALHGLIVLKMANKLNSAVRFEDIRKASTRLITRGAAGSAKRDAGESER